MAKTGSQRTKEWRERKKKKGLLRIDTYIRPSAARRLARLKKKFDESNAQIIDRALKSLEAEVRMGVRKRDEKM